MKVCERDDMVILDETVEEGEERVFTTGDEGDDVVGGWRHGVGWKLHEGC